MRSKVVVATVLLLSAGAVWKLQELTESPRPGDAFDLADGSMVGFGSGNSHHVGQEIVVVQGNLLNESSEPVEITSITLDDEQTQNVKIVNLGLVRRHPETDGILLGAYQTSPLTVDMGDYCADGVMEPVTTRIAPNEHYLVAYHIRFRGPGTYSLRYPIVHYRSGSEEFFEILRIEVSGEVKDSTKPVPVRKHIAKCVDEETVLPGNRLK